MTRILAYDATPTPVWNVATFWRLGALVFFWKFDVVVKARSWGDILDACADRSDVDLQFWGHGYPGTATVGEEHLPQKDPRWSNVDRLWLRACSTMNGVRGLALVNALAWFGCAVVGHRCIIGLFGHSHLVGASFDQNVWWPMRGVFAGLWSKPWLPRTISPLRMTLPKWWNHPDKEPRE